MMRGLVIGVSGQLGGSLLEELGPTRAVGTHLSTPVGDSIRFDLRDATPDGCRRLIDQTDAEVIFITAGMNHVDECEKDPELTARINGQVPGMLARAGASEGRRTVFYSTEYVFDGQSGPYEESATPNPLSAYGRSKFEGERRVLEGDPQALVIRTTVVFGPELRGKNFAYRLGSALRDGREIDVPDDQCSSPTYNRDLANASIVLAANAQRGIWHVAGPEVMARSELARRVAAHLGMDENLIRPVPTSRLRQAAPRPLRAGLSIGKFCAEGLSTMSGGSMRSVEAAIDHWIAHPRGKPWPA